MPKPKSTPAVVQTSAHPAPDALIAVLTTDEFAGQGGSYVYDAAAGKRTRQPDLLPDPE